jgi:hypothetical protein
MAFGLRGRWFRRARAHVGFACLCALTPRPAVADRILVEPDPRERGYIPVEELSHEVLIEPGQGFDATMRVRTALYNASSTRVDFVHLLALPHGAELVGLRTARDGVWSEDEIVESAPRGVPSLRVDDADVTTFAAFATALDTRGADLAAAKLFGWGLESGETVQVELVVRVRPRLRGSRWSLDLPRRGEQQVIHDRRGVLVRGATGARRFWVDGRESTGKIVATRGADGATVSWAAALGRGEGLLAHAEAVPNSAAAGAGGTLRLYLQAGTQPHTAPDHISFLYDASSSVRGDLRDDALRVTRQIVDSQTTSLTVDALAFDRDIVPLMSAPIDATTLPDLRASFRHAGLADVPARAGTNIIDALRKALERVPDSSRAPTLIVFSDGMFPRIGAEPLNELLALLRRLPHAPQIVLVVDDPLLARAGLGAAHPASEFAAKIGARIRSIELNTLESLDMNSILSAPRVIGDIRVRASSSTTFDRLATGLIGGTIETLEGRYTTVKPPKSISVRALSGRSRMRARVPVKTVAPRGRAFVSSANSIERITLAESVQAPQWYRPSMEETFRAQLGRASFDTDARVGALSQDLMSMYLRRRVLPRVKACYNEALRRDGTLGGRVVVSYQIAKGEVMAAAVATTSLSAQDPSLDRCLERAAWKLEVPAGRLDARRYDVRYPVQLSPPEGGKAPSSESELSPLVQMMLDSAEILAR